MDKNQFYLDNKELKANAIDCHKCKKPALPILPCDSLEHYKGKQVYHRDCYQALVKQGVIKEQVA